MSDFFDKVYYGNTLTQWFVALLLMVLFFAIAKVLYWISNNWVKSLARKAQIRIDDNIADIVKGPLTAIFTLFGFRYSLNTLNLSDDVASWIIRGFQLIIALIIVWMVVKLYDAFHNEYLIKFTQKTETDLEEQLLPAIRSGIKFIVISLGILIGLNNAGYDVSAVLAGLGLGGLAFALAGQDTVANLFGGIIIFLQRPFKTGDRINVAGVEGYVREVGIRTSLIETISGEKVLLPNKVFGSEAISNLDIANFYYQTELFYIHRNTTLEQLEKVLAALKEAINQNEHVVWSEPVLAKAGEYSFDIRIDYGINPWNPEQPFVHHVHKLGVVKSQINQTALKVFDSHNIRLALPVLLFTDQMTMPDYGLFARE